MRHEPLGEIVTQLLLPLNDELDPRRVDWLTCVTGLPREWDRAHPAYLRYGLGPVLSVPRRVLWSLRALDRIG